MSSMGIRVTSDLRNREEQQSDKWFDVSESSQQSLTNARREKTGNVPGPVGERVVIQPLVRPSQTQRQHPLRNLFSVLAPPQTASEPSTLVSSTLVQRRPRNVPEREHDTGRRDERLSKGLVSESDKGRGRVGDEVVGVLSGRRWEEVEGRDVGSGEVVEGERGRGLLRGRVDVPEKA
jgi:hypothetical protein